MFVFYVGIIFYNLVVFYTYVISTILNFISYKSFF